MAKWLIRLRQLADGEPAHYGERGTPAEEAGWLDC
jgi:hypothetical protein